MAVTGRFQGDLPERAYHFSRLIIQIIKSMPRRTEGWVIGKQLARSGTAIGANICEADVALTDREFIMFCKVARREAFETRYWLRLCVDELGLASELLESATKEVNELARILTTIVRKSKQSLQQLNR